MYLIIRCLYIFCIVLFISFTGCKENLKSNSDIPVIEKLTNEKQYKLSDEEKEKCRFLFEKSKKPKVIFRFWEGKNYCQTNIDIFLDQIAKDSVYYNNQNNFELFFCGTFLTQREALVFEKNKKVKNVYNIPDEVLKNPINDNYSRPFLAVVDSNYLIHNVFFPERSIEAFITKYFKLLDSSFVYKSLNKKIIDSNYSKSDSYHYIELKDSQKH